MELLRSLVASHVLSTQVDSMDATGLAPRALGIPFSDGTVQVSSTSRIRRVLSLTIPDPRWLPQSDDDALSPYSARIRVRQGVKFPDGTIETAPVGVFRIESIDGDEQRGPVELVGHSLEAMVIDARFESPRQASGPSCVGLIQTLIVEANPTAEVVVATIQDAPVPRTTWDEDRWGAIEELATAIGCDVYCDPLGRYVIADVVDPATAAPTRTLKSGTGGTLKSVLRGISREGVFNSVVARSSGLSVAKPIQAVARDTDALSPTRWGGPFGKVPRFWSSPLVSTQTQALLAAQSILSKSIGLTKSVSIEAVPDPTIDAGTAVRIIPNPDAAPNGEIHVLESFPLRLAVGGNRFTAATRTTTYIPEDVSA